MIDPTSIFDRPIAFHRGFVFLGCGISGALMLSQAVYWSKRTDDPDGWFYKKAFEWEEETGLTRREQETARAKLNKCGVLQEKKQGVPCKLFYRVDFYVLLQLCGFGETSMAESAKLDVRKAPNKNGEMCQSSTETTTEITTETTNISAQVSELFNFWVQTMGKASTTKLDSKRSTAIKKRLSDGYSVDYIKTAIVNCSKTPHNMGHNDRGQPFNDIELICRNASNLERFNESMPSMASAVKSSSSGSDTLGDFQNRVDAQAERIASAIGRGD